MRLRELEIFNALMRAGTTIAAAEALGVSQPGVSKAIKHLESQVGVPLFTRLRGRLCPTPEAQLLYRHVHNVFARLETVNRVARDLRGGRDGVVSVAATPTVANSILAFAVARYRSRQPRRQVIFRSLTSHEVAQRVGNGEADFGIVHSPVDGAGLGFETLLTTEIACIMPADHPLSRLRIVAPADIVPHPLVSYRPGTRIGSAIQAAFRDCGVDKEIDVQTSLSTTACMIVRQGGGVALTDPFATVHPPAHDLVLRPFRPRVPVHLQLVFARDTPRSRTAEQLVQTLHDVAADLLASTWPGPATAWPGEPATAPASAPGPATAGGRAHSAPRTAVATASVAESIEKPIREKDHA